MLAGSIGGGILGTLNLAWPYLARAGCLAIAFIVAMLAMHDLGFSPRKVGTLSLPAEIRKIGQDSIAHGWRNRSVRLLIIAGFVQAAGMLWGFYAAQPYLLDLLGQNLPWVTGVIAALVSIARIGGGWLIERLSRVCGRRTTLLLWSIALTTAATVGMGLATSFWLAVVLFLVAMGARGAWIPVKQAYIHQEIPSDKRATVVSFDSLVASGGNMTGQIALGGISQSYSLAAGYVVGGLFTGLAMPVLWVLRRQNDTSDRLVARRYGPAPGTPAGG
jgi:predicted MFS family arabinose efflux permease